MFNILHIKELMMDNEQKTFYMKSGISILAFIVAIVIGFIALFIPPQGIIDSSVLWWTSQLLLLCATFLGVDLKISDLRHKKNGD